MATTSLSRDSWKSLGLSAVSDLLIGFLKAAASVGHGARNAEESQGTVRSLKDLPQA